MQQDKDALSQRVQESFLRLSSTAANLNSVSDKLNSSVSRLEDSLKRIGLGITSWVPFTSWISQDRCGWDFEEIGYAKVNGKWGLSIRTRSGNEASDSEDVELWPFNEAPRHLRVRAVAKIPELIDQLSKDAADIAGKVNEQISEVDFLTSAISAVIPPRTEAKKK